MSFLIEIRTHKIRVLKTLALFACFIAHGLVMGVLGPSMMDLEVSVGTTMDKIAYIVTARAGGFAVGSFFTGIFYEKLNVPLTLGVCTALTSFLVAFIPYWRTLYSLISAFIVMGIIMGFGDANINVFLIHIWGKENPPFMQALHFCYGLGALLAPLIIEPFLLPSREEGLLQTSLDFLEISFSSPLSNVSSSDSLNGNVTHLVISPTKFTPDDVQLIYPYFMIAGYFVVVSSIFLTLWKLSPETPAHPSRIASSNNEVSKVDSINTDKSVIAREEHEQHEKQQRKYRLLVIAVITLFMHLYCGIENTFGSFISPYAVECDLHLTQQTGALMSSVFWISFTFFRLFAVFYIQFVGNEKNITFNILLTIVSNIIMVPFGNNSEWALWTGSVIMGLGLSSISASVLGYLEDYFQVTSKIAASFMIASCFGHLTIPAILSPFLETYPQLFLWISAIYTILMAMLFAVAVLICRFKLVKGKDISQDTLKM